MNPEQYEFHIFYYSWSVCSIYRIAVFSATNQYEMFVKGKNKFDHKKYKIIIELNNCDHWSVIILNEFIIYVWQKNKSIFHRISSKMRKHTIYMRLVSIPCSNMLRRTDKYTCVSRKNTQ